MKAPTNAEGYIVNEWDYGDAATAVAAVGVRENGSQGAKAPTRHLGLGPDEDYDH